MKKQWVEIICFKLSWAVALWSAVENQPLISLAIAMIILSSQLIVSVHQKQDLLKLMAVVLGGACLEVLNRFLGFYDFSPSQKMPPLWLLAFWPTFAILFFSFVPLLYHKSRWTQWFLGFTGGLGYFAGEWIHRMNFYEPKELSLLLFSALWGLEFMLLVAVCKKIDKTKVATS